VIIGRPNVGKSSLLNAWCRCDRAIVTDLPGTTRDLVESHLVVGGIPIQVLDTAGIRKTDDPIEQMGVTRSQQAAQSADLVLLTIDAPTGWTETDQQLFQQFQAVPIILIINKVDLAPATQVQYPPTIAQVVSTVAAQDQGIDHLEAAILATVQTQSVQAANLDWAINQRQAAALRQAQTALEHVLVAILDHLPLDFWTIDLRGAIQALGEITGEEITESVLDRIFSKFCIGK
jgi:tRNA modification GTPase